MTRSAVWAGISTKARDPLHYPAYLRFVQQTVTADPRIRILHAHNEAMGLYALKGAEKAGLPVRIAHAHNIWIVRDYKFRGSDANFTLKMWPNVRRGEKLYISPYKENADLMFDSSLACEFSVLKPFVVPLRASTTLEKQTGSTGDRSFLTPSSRRLSGSTPPSAPKCGRATGWKTGWCWAM